jgi:hypothetical protein
MRPGWRVRVVVVAAVEVCRVAGRRRALHLGRRRSSRGAPFLHEARDSEHPTEFFRERLQEIVPRHQGRITGKAPFIDLLTDHHEQAIERKNFEHLANRR